MWKSIEEVPHRVLLTAVILFTLLLLGGYMNRSLQMTDGVLGAPLDDAWIHFQFARNLSQGAGFSFNAGEPTPGSTAPLWTVLLAGVGLFTEDFLVPALLLSGGFFLLTIGFTYGLTYSLSGAKWVALLAAVGVALSGRLLWAGLAAMETTAFAALSVAAVWRMQQQGGLRPLPALLFGLASQMRPEGHALFAFAGGLQLWQGVVQVGWRQTVRQLVLPGVVYGLTAAPYALFSLATTGQPLPNTFYAKVGTDDFFSWRALRETVRLHWYDNPTSFLLAILGLVPLWRRNRLALVWLLGLLGLTAVVVDFVWHHGRYTMPLIPFQMMAAALGAHWLWQQVQGEAKRPLGVLLAVLFVVGGSWQLGTWATMLGNNSREILDIDVALGYWLAENTPPDALIAVDDIGAITFLSERRIVDLNGLVSPEMWPAVRQPIGLPRNQVAARILAEAEPAYMVGFALWHWELATTPTVAEPIWQVETATHTMIAEQEAAVYRMTWPYVKAAEPQVTVDALLGDAIILVGYDWQQAGDVLDLTLYWQSETAVGMDYDVFVHLFSAEGELVTQTDGPPLQGLAATSVWQAGDVIRDPRQLLLPEGSVVEDYTVGIGLYERASGQRLTSSEFRDGVVFLSEWP